MRMQSRSDVAQQCIPSYIARHESFAMSQDTHALLQERAIAIKRRSPTEAVKALTKRIRKSHKADKKKYASELVDKEMDVRDRYAGLKYLKKSHAPRPYAFKDRQWRHIPMAQAAEVPKRKKKPPVVEPRERSQTRTIF